MVTGVTAPLASQRSGGVYPINCLPESKLMKNCNQIIAGQAYPDFPPEAVSLWSLCHNYLLLPCGNNQKLKSANLKMFDLWVAKNPGSIPGQEVCHNLAQCSRK